MKQNSTGILPLLIAILLMWTLAGQCSKKEVVPEMTFGDFMMNVEKGNVKEVTIENQNILGVLNDKTAFKTFAPHYPDLAKILLDKKVKVTAKPPEELHWLIQVLLNWFPMLLLFGLYIFFMRGMMGGAGGNAMRFAQSKAKLLSEKTNSITFADVAGVEEAKDDLKEIIEFLRDSKKFTKLGARIPKGCLLVGLPGTGKTLLARAVAGEASVPFYSISGSDFVEMFVGVGASRVRDLFAQGQKNAPCIIFIDEIDAVGRHRGAGLGGGHDEREQTLNQLLVEMDGFNANAGVIIMAATNRPDVLDPALLRPGRFDRRVVVPRPDIKGREAIFKVHAKKTPLEENVDLEVLARGTPGFTGADIENMVNEAALLAARRNKEKTGMEEFELAKDRVMMGSERKSMIISQKEKEITSYHESGHALVAKLIEMSGGEVDPVHKVSIIPRGMALGITQQLPLDDKYTYSKEYLVNRLLVCFGGRAAEEIVFNKITTGAKNDIDVATEIAHKMVCEWGMSEKLGPMTFGKKEQEIFLGRDFSQIKDYSEDTAKRVDAEVQSLIRENYRLAKEMLKKNEPLLHKTAKFLLEKETIDGADLTALIKENNENPRKV